MAYNVLSKATTTLLFTSQIFSGLATAQNNDNNSSSSGGGSGNDDLPVVDLGYELHRARAFNSTGNYYNFTNIRYAAPPLGELRFAASQKPKVNRTDVQDGSQGRTCPQASPDWLAVAPQFIERYLDGETDFNQSSFPSSNSSESSSSPSSDEDSNETEDCLFLDVVAPQKVFDNAGTGYGAPVLAWIYGGGYIQGTKDSSSFAGLIHASQSHEGDGVITVAINYRLGAFGWLSGPTFQTNGTANAGLHDQRLALEWIQENIAKFGGDPNRVTVFGQSAGGGSIMHHMTAWGGAKGPAPFAQAILQSPGYLPIVSNRQQEEVFQDFLDRLNVSTIQEARQLPSRELMAANRAQVQATPLYGGFTYGPAVDGGYVPGLPIHQMMLGKFDRGVRVMVGHNADEGLLFTSPFLQNTSAIEQDLIGTLPTLKGAEKPLNYILNDLYPPVSNSSSQQTNYTNSIGRGAQAKGDIVILSNAYILNKAYANETYSYRFSVYPALHGQDVPYTFYNGPSPDVESPDVATILQGYITRFAMTGSPNGPGLPYFSKFGSNSTVQVLNDINCYPATDPTGNERNAYWSKVLYV